MSEPTPQQPALPLGARATWGPGSLRARNLSLFPTSKFFPGAILLVVTAVLGCSLYANLSLVVKNPAHYRFFPPFQRGVNGNRTDHFGGEYYHIATALRLGRGYADPFGAPTGPTAWMPPVLSWLLAALLWLANGNKEVLRAMLVLLQNLALMGNGLLILALARQTTGRVGPATAVFLAGLVYYFELSFQFTHDCWLVLGVLDLLIAGLVWGRPLDGGWRRALGWGAFGGFCALSSPVAALAWGVLTLVTGRRPGQRIPLVVALGAAILTVAPWVARNYLVFGRLIPVKSNLAYELYQSQCLQPGGVLHDPIFRTHPNSGRNREGLEYQQLGEMAFLDRKRDLFWQVVRANPADFAGRLANRFLAATLLYSPFNAHDETRHPWRVWLTRLIYPLPFLSILILLASSPGRPLAPIQWIVIGVYLCYLIPYIAISYYERYKFPLVGAEIVLTVWGLGRLKRIWINARSRETARAAATRLLAPLSLPHPARFLIFRCSGCGKKLRIRAASAGMEVRCPCCARPIHFPEVAPAVVLPAPVKEKIPSTAIRAQAKPGDAL